MTDWMDLIEEEHGISSKWIPPRTDKNTQVVNTKGAKVRLFLGLRGNKIGLQLINPVGSQSASGSAKIPYHTLTRDELKAVGMACIRTAMEMKDE